MNLLPVVAEMLTDSVFPQEELDIFSKNMQQRLLVGLKKSEFVAGRLIDSYLFGENHPYGKISSAKDYADLQQDEIKNFYEKYYKQGSCVIFVAGKLPKDIIQQLDNNFGSLATSPKKFCTEINHHIIHAKEKKYNIVNDVNGVQGSDAHRAQFPKQASS